MSATLEEPAAPTVMHASVRADTLAASVVILLVMTVAQRLIGFGRGIFFCRWMSPEQLGQWDVAFGFLNLAAPLAVLGLPGSFGRYVAFFRQRRQFHAFLRRTAAICGLTTVTALLLMLARREYFSRLIFGEVDELSLVGWLALCLAVIIVHNFLTSLFIAARMYRYVTVLQFAQSLAFAVISLGLLACWPLGATSVVLAYGAATFVSGIGAWHWLRQLTDSEPDDEQVSQPTALWSKLVPFALWVWITNLSANLFEVIDRYMIIHHSGMSAHAALEQVGYYHSSRIVPLLFVSVAALLGSLITPHLSHDWELGRRAAVVSRLNFTLKLMLYVLFGVSLVVLFGAPRLYGMAFQNKFAGGLAVLPCTLVYCAWFGTFAVAQNYLWCAERAGQSSGALVLGLLVNIVLNLAWLPRFGLPGAVWATTIANLVALSLVYGLSMWHGMRVDAGTWILTLALLALSAGAVPALAVFAVLSLLALSSDIVLTREEKRHVRCLLSQALHKLPFGDRLLDSRFRKVNQA